MRFGPDDKLWVVTDPARESELGDVCSETTVRGLLLQLKGGLDNRCHWAYFHRGIHLSFRIDDK